MLKKLGFVLFTTFVIGTPVYSQSQTKAQVEVKTIIGTENTVKSEVKLTQPEPTLEKATLQQNNKVVFTSEPYFYLDQPGRKLSVYDGIGNTHTFYAATASPGNRNKPGKYKFIQASQGLHHFTGWGNPVMVYNSMYFIPEKDKRSFDYFVRTGTFVSSLHTQPKTCGAGIAYLAKRQSYTNKAIVFFKQNDTLRKTNPNSFNKAYMLFKSSNPEPINPCPEAPLVPWGESHGCVRLGKAESEYVMNLYNFLEKQGKQPMLYVDVKPPTIPVSAETIEQK